VGAPVVDMRHMSVLENGKLCMDIFQDGSLCNRQCKLVPVTGIMRFQFTELILRKALKECLSSEKSRWMI
jgi:hypothetical protein